MPKEVKHIKEFMKLSKKEDMKYVVVKKLGDNGRKFKLRGSKYLYTFKIYDEDKAKKLQDGLPIELEKRGPLFKK
ncbi:60S ribosomal protein L38 [Anaeramoeba flamelloides]|uniref:60S ribosomal protein L38 n=1 Tax=Anaeramoeba flamelloides TaxID=1746091 RepID=A0AAV7Y762_9EUKA|nr:60S ribosomal protein L38 [Anaeramoeba flamelloides]KAJ3424650.1 60S ribosomal protein L38 [Anaeramoeba flamelloides]KAJ3431456.1 60S ribosomal protein L38 [Anaeramoeba flamelloides]KAJ6227911.1 60S ribosomal protein L38 [Anaeramoeba flamelloides]KAJ6247551.1 60S ribosomal protein L38 [Anaeramoeba flamelloides]